MSSKNPISLDPLSKAIEVLVSLGLDPLRDKIQRSEKVMRALNQLGWRPNSPPANDFEGVYAYTLVFYGVGKPRFVLEFFRHPFIKDAFHKSFLQKNPKNLEEEAENLLDWNEIGKEFLQSDYHPKNEFLEFRKSFIEYALSTRTIPEVLRDQVIEHISEALTELPTKIDVKNIFENVSADEREKQAKLIGKS